MLSKSVEKHLLYTKPTTTLITMSFAEPKTFIVENDTVILYLTVQSFHAIEVVPFIKNKKDELRSLES